MQQVRSLRSSTAARWATRARLLALASCLACATSASSARAEREACLAAHEQGQVARLAERFSEAREQLRRCMQPACPKLLREDCRALLADLDASRASVVFQVAGATGEDLSEVRVLANDQPITTEAGQAVALDPGTYQLRFEAPEHRPLEQTLVLRQGEKSRVVRVELESVRVSEPVLPDLPLASAAPAERRSTRGLRIASYVLGGSALAVLAAAIGLGAKGKAEHDHLSDVCGAERACDQDDTQKGRSLYVAADAGFGVSGALAAAAVTTFLVDYLRDDRDTASARNALAVQPGGTGAAFVYRRAF